VKRECVKEGIIFSRQLTDIRTDTGLDMELL